MMSAVAPATSNTFNEPLLSTFSSRSNEAAPMVVGFDAATIIDLVGRIGRAVANFYGPDDYVRLDTHLTQLLPNTDTGLRRFLTLAVLAGAQEDARFGVMMVASADGQLPAGPALDFALNQLGRLSYAFGAFVNPPVDGVVERITSPPHAAVDDIRRLDDCVVMNSQPTVTDVGGTAQWLDRGDGTRPPDTVMLDQCVAHRARRSLN